MRLQHMMLRLAAIFGAGLGMTPRRRLCSAILARRGRVRTEVCLQSGGCRLAGMRCFAVTHILARAAKHDSLI